MLEIVAWVLIYSGAGFCLVGAIGVLRFPDVYSRMHSAGITDTLGALLVLFGLFLLAGFSIAGAKLLFILVFLWMTTPTATHALAVAARRDGVKPLLNDEKATETGSSAP